MTRPMILVAACALVCLSAATVRGRTRAACQHQQLASGDCPTQGTDCECFSSCTDIGSDYYACTTFHPLQDRQANVSDTVSARCSTPKHHGYNVRCYIRVNCEYVGGYCRLVDSVLVNQPSMYNSNCPDPCN